MQQLQMEAQHRWLRPAEICEILCNYEKFHIAPEPPNKPPSMVLQIIPKHYLFDIIFVMVLVFKILISEMNLMIFLNIAYFGVL